MKIDQTLNITPAFINAIDKGSGGVNIFVNYKPVATIGEQRDDAAIQTLYSVCTEMLERGMEMVDWRILARQVMLHAACDKHKTKIEAAKALGLAAITDMHELEHIK